MARPEKPIDWEQVDRFLEAGCTQKQIAGALGLGQDALHDRFMKKYGCNYTDYVDSKRQCGDSLLLAAQMKKALAGNTTMLMWLGKVRLGQREADQLDYQHSTIQKHEEALSYLKEIRNDLLSNQSSFQQEQE